MPHECTDCGRAFDDGSTEMLSGCPACGGTTFQFKPADGSATDDDTPPAPPVEGGVARTVGSAASTVRNLVGDSGGPPPESAPAAGAQEDAAQASARSEVVSKDHLPPAPDRPLTTEESVARQRAQAEAPDPEPDVDERPDLAELRAELNEQFESIKVLEPGQYELNLMELYDREEYIIALQEDGKYTIQVPERWQD